MAAAKAHQMPTNETNPGVPSADILGAPTPVDDGSVLFSVGIGGRAIEVTASPLGVGASRSEDRELANAAVTAVFAFLRSHRAEEIEWYRVAAKLRRQARKPPLAGTTESEDSRVVGGPTARSDGMILVVMVRNVELRVGVFRSGHIVDDCDAWESVTAADRDAAMGTALDWIFENPGRASEFGLDVALLDELWR